MGVKVLLWVDDLLVRGMRADTDAFHSALEERFECRDGARQYLTYDHHIEYCGLKISVADTADGDLYSIDQSDDVATFLLDFDLQSEPIRTSPMTRKLFLQFQLWFTNLCFVQTMVHVLRVSLVLSRLGM